MQGGKGAQAKGGRRKAKLAGEEWLTQRPGSAEYYYDITIDGRRFRRSCQTTEITLAAAFSAREYDRLYRQVMLGEIPLVEMTLNDAGVRWWDEAGEGTSYGKTQASHIAIMIEILGKGVLLSALDDILVHKLVQALKRRRIVPHNVADPTVDLEKRPTLSPSTINRYLNTLSVVCNHARTKARAAVGDWSLAEHEMDEPEGREVFLEHAEARALWDAAVLHLRPILLLELTTGLRKANVHDLTWEQVSIDMRKLVLLQKGGRPLSVELVPMAVTLLEELQPAAEKRKGPVFFFGNPAVGCACAACKSRVGDPIKGTKRAFGTAVREAGLSGRGVRFHDLRHTFASLLLHETGNLKLVQEALGHRNIQTTMRYAHLLDGGKARAITGATAGLEFGKAAEPPALPTIKEGKKTA